MRKLIVFASALALSGSMAFTMDEDAMDEEMMDAPAPSVTLSGAAEIGFKNIDDDSDPDAESLRLIRAYKVTFASTGTTDGGLMFGAGMSIEDDTEENDKPEVLGSHVYVGGADGSWKLKFGGNDPGIDVVGGIGVADDHFGGEDDKTIGLEGAFGGTSYRFTMANPEAKDKADGDWSAGISHSLGDISVGVGMDSERGLAISVGSEISGVGLSAYYSSSDESTFTQKERVDKAIMDNLAANSNASANAETGADAITDRFFPENSTIVVGDHDENSYGMGENKGLGLKASVSAGEGSTLTFGYSTLKRETSGIEAFYSADGTAQAADADPNLAISGQEEVKRISVDFSYDLGGGATFKAGIEKDDMTFRATAKNTADTSVLPDGSDEGADPDDSFSFNTSSDKTTLKALLAFSF